MSFLHCEYSLASGLPVTFRGVCCEGRTQYVTDSAKGCVELVTPLDGTVEFLTHLRDFFRNFGIHLLGQTGMDSTLVDAQTCLQGVTRLFKRCVSDVRLQIGSERITNGPEGTVANKTMQSCELMLRSTTRLLKASEFMSPEATHAIKLQSLLTWRTYTQPRRWNTQPQVC